MSDELKALMTAQCATVQELSSKPHDADLIRELLDRDLTFPEGVGPGRLLLIPHANSYAYYFITKVEGSMVRVKSLMIQNGYKASSVFNGTTPLWYAKQIVELRDMLRR